MTVKIKARLAVPWWQRWRRRWRALRGGGLGKTHQVHLVTIGQLSLKRVQFADPDSARRIAANLEALKDPDAFPRLLMQQGAELWLEYIPGRLARLNDAADGRLLVDFFVRLYRSAPMVTVDAAPYTARLQRDLDFLSATGVLSRARADQLRALERHWCPSAVWVGPDYLDPLGKNFVIRGERAVAIDIEALSCDSPLGTGLAKAMLRWPFDPAPAVLAGLAAHGGPDLAPQLPWTRLCFLCDYFKQKLLQGKPGYLRLEALDSLLATRKTETPP